MNFESSDNFSLRDDLVLEEVDGDVVVLDLEGNQYFGLNDVAWMIWRGIEERDLTFGEIVEEIVEEFGISDERARRDAGAFVEQLVDEGLADRREAK